MGDAPGTPEHDADINLAAMIDHVGQAISLADKHNLETAGMHAAVQKRQGIAFSHGGCLITDSASSRMNVLFSDLREKKSGWASGRQLGQKTSTRKR